MGSKWKMPIAVIGKPTGDGRQFAEDGELTHRDLPLPLRYVRADDGGHKSARIVGHISRIGKPDGGMLPAQGEFYDSEDWPEDIRQYATEARMLTGNKVIGPSVDLDEAEMERVPEPKALKEHMGKLAAAKKEAGADCGCGMPLNNDEALAELPHLNMVRKGRIASATLVHIPAFAELAGHATIIMDDHDPNISASAELDYSTLHEWSDDEAEQFRNFDKNVGGGVDRDKLKTSDFIDPIGRRFPIVTAADVSDAVSSYGRANPKIPYEKFKARLTAIAKRKGFEDALPDEWKQKSITAAGAPVAPPAAWFANPKFDKPTPLTIDPDGRVYGHVAAWGTCHTGIGDSCIKPPKSRTNYAYFHTGEVLTAEGERVAVGRLTYGTGHAAHNLGYRAAAEHYDNSGNTGAVVRAGEDEHGIWVAGAMVPEADERIFAEMRRTPLSGDWRRVGGNLEMLAALHVNTAGFPIPRVQIASGEPYALVAAGVVAPPHQHEEPTGADGVREVARQAALEVLAEQRAQQAREREFETVLASVEDYEYERMQHEYAALSAQLALID